MLVDFKHRYEALQSNNPTRYGQTRVDAASFSPVDRLLRYELDRIRTAHDTEIPRSHVLGQQEAHLPELCSRAKIAPPQ